MTADVPLPDEFRLRADTYADIVPMHVDGAYYRDGQLVQSTVRDAPEIPEEEKPGWTVQGR